MEAYFDHTRTNLLSKQYIDNKLFDSRGNILHQIIDNYAADGITLLDKQDITSSGYGTSRVAEWIKIKRYDSTGELLDYKVECNFEIPVYPG